MVCGGISSNTRPELHVCGKGTMTARSYIWNIHGSFTFME